MQTQLQSTFIMLQQFNPKEIPKSIGWYLAGFADGEGSFYVTFRYRNDYFFKWRVTPVFNVSNKDKVMMALFKKHLKCGSIRNIGDNKFLYEVDSLKPLQNNIIPFFREYRFFSSKKKKEFSVFQKIVAIVAVKPRQISHIHEILKLRVLLGSDRASQFRNTDAKILKVLKNREK